VTNASANDQIDLLAEFETAYGAQLLGATIMRIRGELHFWASGSAAAGDTVAWAYGIGIFPDVATNLLASARPHEDWMHYGGHSIVVGDIPTGATDSLDGSGEIRVPVDVKARRKIDEMGEDLVFHIERVAAGSATNLNLSYTRHLSILIALP